jgi:hypothetical protein
VPSLAEESNSYPPLCDRDQLIFQRYRKRGVGRYLVSWSRGTRTFPVLREDPIVCPCINDCQVWSSRQAQNPVEVDVGVKWFRISLHIFRQGKRDRLPK